MRILELPCRLFGSTLLIVDHRCKYAQRSGSCSDQHEIVLEPVLLLSLLTGYPILVGVSTVDQQILADFRRID